MPEGLAYGGTLDFNIDMKILCVCACICVFLGSRGKITLGDKGDHQVRVECIKGNLRLLRRTVSTYKIYLNKSFKTIKREKVKSEFSDILCSPAISYGTKTWIDLLFLP